MPHLRRVCGFCAITLAVNAGIAASADSPLVDAIKRTDRAAIRALVNDRSAIDAAEADGMTPLHWAVHRDDPGTVDLLIGAGAAVNVKTRYGVTPLSLACTNGSAALVERLLKAGADANAASPEGETVLMNAATNGNVDVLKLLIAHGAQVNVHERWKGQTALMWAASENHTAAVKLLLEVGAELKARTPGGFTPLLFAIRDGALDTVRMLLDAGADPNDMVQPAVVRGGGVINGRMDARSGGTNALLLAIVNAHYELAALLLDRGADPNSPQPQGTALHAMAWMRRPGSGRGYNVRPTGNLDSIGLVAKLLEKGANPNVGIAWKEKKIVYDRPEVQTPPNITIGRNYLSFVGATPFYLAAKHSDVALMRLLVEHGANPLTPTVQGITPLMAAAGVGFWDGESPGPATGVPESESLEAVKLALQLGNDIHATTNFGDKTIEGDGVYLLTHNPANFNELVEGGALGDMRWGGVTALHGAALRNANAIVKFLVEKGAPLDAASNAGWTPLTVAYGLLVANTFKDWPDTVALLRRLMIEHGLDPAKSMRCDICADARPTAAPQPQQKQ